jgi:hypothetical protein
MLQTLKRKLMEWREGEKEGEKEGGREGRGIEREQGKW